VGKSKISVENIYCSIAEWLSIPILQQSWVLFRLLQQSGFLGASDEAMLKKVQNMPSEKSILKKKTLYET
jgi:hypothetical protein